MKYLGCRIYKTKLIQSKVNIYQDILIVLSEELIMPINFVCYEQLDIHDVNIFLIKVFLLSLCYTFLGHSIRDATKKVPPLGH